MTYTLPERNEIIERLWALENRLNLPNSPILSTGTATLEAKLQQLEAEDFANV